MTTIIKKKKPLETSIKWIDPIVVPSVHDTVPVEVYSPHGWYGQVYLLNSVLQRMTSRGIPVSPTHHANFSTTLEEAKRKLLTKIDELIAQREQEKGTSLFNDELGDDGRKVLPKKVREMLAGQATTQIVICRRKNKETGKFEMVEEEQKILPRYTTAGAKDRYPAFPEEYLEWFIQACQGLGYVWKIDKANRGVLAVKREFNPGSPNQLKAYCAWQGYKIPTSLKKTAKGKEEKQSVDDKALEELSKSYKDEIFELIQEYRELDKLLGTYVPGWEPGKDGRVHSTFTFQPATGQLSSRNPNVQNAPSSGEFKKLIRADEGKVIVEFDFVGYHAMMLGYFAKSPSYMRLSQLGIHDFLAAHIIRMKISQMKQEDLETDLWQQTIANIADLDTWLSLDDKLLKDKLKWIKSNHNFIRNKQAKPACVAEGELVLTSRGLVPIESVSLDDRLWDGVEWVTHEGIIYQGEREVTYYEGLWATPDHEVFTRREGKIQFQTAQAGKISIERTGVGGKEVRTSRDYFEQDTKGQGVYLFEGEVSRLPAREASKQGQFAEWANEWLQELCANYMSSLKYVGESLGRYYRQVSQATKSAMEELWRQRDRSEVCLAEGVYPVGMGESTARELQGCGDRQDRQQWALRTGESPTSYEATELQQSKLHNKSELERRASSNNRLGESLHLRPYQSLSETRANRRADMGERKKAKVYDIVNAGPRNRFTVNNLLVSNCHGIGFGMGTKKLYDMNKGSFKSLKEAEAVRGVMRGLFPEVFRFQDKIVEQAHRDKKIITPFGYVRRFWEAMTYKPGKGLVPGEDAEKVKAYLPANTAFAVKKCAMIRLEGLGANEKYGLFNEVHDSLMYMPKEEELEECIEVVVQEMTRPVEELGGLSCGVEVKYGPSWGETKEWKI